MNSDKKSDSISYIGKGKNVVSTDTELHLDLFADPTKLKPVSKIVKMDKINEDSDSDDSHIVNKALNSDSDSVSSKSSSSGKSRRSSKSSVSRRSKRSSSSSSSSTSSSSSSSARRSSKTRSSTHKKLDDYVSNFNNIKMSESRQVPVTETQGQQNQGQQDQVQQAQYVPKYTTEREIRFRKMELLAILAGIKKRRELSKSYSMSSEIADMEDEVRFHTELEQKQVAVEFSKDGLLKICQFMEVMNGTFDPFGLQLKGWHGQMKANIDNYDGVFGELFEKYKHYVGKVEPEYKLMYMVFGSAASFHYSKQFVEQYGLEKLVDKNPELLQKIQANIASTLEKNIGKKEEPKATQQMPKMTQQQMYQQMVKEKQELEAKLQAQDTMLKQQQQHMAQQVQPQQAPLNSNTISPHLSKMMEIQQSQAQNPLHSGSGVEMKKPSGLNDLLARVKASNGNSGISIPLVDTPTSASSRIKVVNTVDSDSIEDTDTVQSVSKMRFGRRQRVQVSNN
jgi:hypothetical protein